MKEEIEKIIIEAQLGNIGSWKAAQQVLDLFAVVGRSEQLPCGDCENYAEWDNGIRRCSVCGTKLS